MSYLDNTDNCISGFYNKGGKCYLLADETGLGKTIESRELIYKMWKDREGRFDFRVLYVAPNLQLAKNNIKKLQHYELKRDTEIVSFDRLSVFSEEMLSREKKIKYFAVTPSVSFFLEGEGTQNEREQIDNKRINNDELAPLINDLISLQNDLFEYIVNDSISDLFGELDYFSLERDWQKDYLKLLDLFKERFVNPRKDSKIRERCQKLARNVRNYKDNRIKETRFIDRNDKVEFFYDNFTSADLRECADIIGSLLELDTSSGKKPGLSKDKCIISLQEEIMQCIHNSYHKLEIYYKRLQATINGIKSFKPDLVIFDEFQNYPGIFKGQSKGEDEKESDEKNIERIMNALQGEKTKVLLLSATPYTYKNIISRDDQSENIRSDDTEDFLNHINIGMEDVLAYINKLNGTNLQHKDLFDNYHSAMRAFVEKFREPGSDPIDEYRKLTDIAESVSKELRAAGMTRNERPNSDYSVEKEDLYIDPLNVSDAEATTFYGNIENDPVSIRRFLSTPVFFPDKNENSKNKNGSLINYVSDKEKKKILAEKTLCTRKRTDKLLNDIFPGDLIPPIFMPPIHHSKDLEGPFAWFNGNEYSKKLLFSAYTNVPPILADLVENKLQEYIGSKISFSTEDENRDEFEKYLGERYAALKDLYSVEDRKDKYLIGFKKDSDNYKAKDDFIKLIVREFDNERSKKIIAKCKKDGLLKTGSKNYWDYVCKYCECGDFASVLDEFFFLLYEEKKNEKELFSLEEYLGNGQGDFSCEYTSRSKISQTDLSIKINRFQSPFAPFNFFLTSVAQEGLDFHWYCNYILHWNVPATPVAMIQREGRINRYRCYALRKQLYNDVVEKYRMDSFGDNWKSFFKKVSNDSDMIAEYKQNGGVDGFYPDHVSFKNKPLKVVRKCYYYPLSEEHFRWKEMLKNMEFYRSLFGAWNPEEGYEDVSESILSFLEKQDKSINIDLRVIGDK